MVHVRVGAIAVLAVCLLRASVLTATAAPDPVLVGAGDIASCGVNGDEQTAALLDAIQGTVFTAGDNAYNDGTAAEYRDCYHPSWGRHRARTKPSPGNHERTGQGYLGYFEGILPAAHPYWYSYDLGSWHIISLDSYCDGTAPRRTCGWDTDQLQWLRADLAATNKACVAAYWHHPRFSSGDHGDTPAVATFWRALEEAGADLVINGHDHSYERFAKQDQNGNVDPDGIQQFVVGTGGADLRRFGAARPNSERRISDRLGVLKLTLHPATYDWEFVTPQGVADSGTGTCSGEVPPTPAERVIMSLRPVADANIYAAYPDRNGGSDRALYADGGPVTRALLRFNPTKLGGTPVEAKLRLWVADGSRDGPVVRRAGNGWLESSVTWSKRPSLSSRALDDHGTIREGRWVTYDVTRAVTGESAVTFALVSSVRDAAAFSSRESRRAPQLVVTVVKEQT